MLSLGAFRSLDLTGTVGPTVRAPTVNRGGDCNCFKRHNQIPFLAAATNSGLSEQVHERLSFPKEPEGLTLSVIFDSGKSSRVVPALGGQVCDNG